jgi:hypothetical protein
MGKYFDPINQPLRAVNKVTVYANIITLSGTTTDGHTAAITINGTVNTTNLSYLTSTTVTADAWCLANYEFYRVRGFLVTAAAGVITVSPAHSWDTTNRINATIATVTGTLTGTLTATCEPDASKAPIWEVTFGVGTGVITAPARIKDDASLRVIVKSNTPCAFSFTGWAHIPTTEKFYIEATSTPYVIDRVSSLVSVMSAPTPDVYYNLCTDDGDEITDETGELISILESVSY